MFKSKNFLLLIILTIIFSCSQHIVTQKEYKKSVENLGQLSLNFDVKKFTLNNGLRVLILENHKLPIFSYYTFFDVGARYETKGLIGATHFLEHMMFKGAKTYGPGQFDKIIEGHGGSNNAYTNLDSTVYYESLPKAALPKIIDLEADRMVNLLLEPTSFETERGVILEERKSNYDNNPRNLLYLKMMENVFRKTPYSSSVIGELADIKALTRDGIADYFKKYYAPNNAIIVIVGDVDTDETIDLIKSKFDSLKPFPDLFQVKAKRDLISLYKFDKNFRREIRLKGPTPVPIFIMAFKGEQLGTRKSYVMDILSSILGDGQSSYFYQNYVKNRRPMLNNVYVYNSNLKHSGVFYIGGDLLKGIRLKSLKKKLIRDTRKLCNHAITERNLQKTKNQYLVAYYDAIQTNNGVARFLGIRENYFNDYSHYKKELSIYDSITSDEVRAVCHEIFDASEYIFASIWNRHPRKK